MLGLFLIILSQISLSEEEAVKRVFQNPLIKAKIEETKSVNYQKKEILSSFFPQLKSSFSYSYSTFVDKMTQKVVVGIDPVTFEPIFKVVEFEFGKPERKTFNASLEWLLFSGLQRVYLLKMLNALKNSKLKEKELKQKEMELSVRMLYTQGLFLKYAIKKYREIIEIIDEHTEVAKKRYKAGFALELDILRSEAEKKRVESQLAEFEKCYVKVLSSLKALCNIPADEEIILSDSLQPDTVFQEKKEKRIDIEILKDNLKMLEYNKKTEYSSFLPKIYGSINYIYGRPYGFFKDEWGGYYKYFIGISLDIFDFGKRWNEIRKKEADRKALLYTLEFLKKNAEEEIISAKEEFESALKGFKAAKKMLELARKSLEISKSQYEKGFISNTDFLDAVRRNLEAEILYLKSLSKLKEAKIRYESTLYGANLNL